MAKPVSGYRVPVSLARSQSVRSRVARESCQRVREALYLRGLQGRMELSRRLKVRCVDAGPRAASSRPASAARSAVGGTPRLPVRSPQSSRELSPAPPVFTEMFSSSTRCNGSLQRISSTDAIQAKDAKEVAPSRKNENPKQRGLSMLSGQHSTKKPLLKRSRSSLVGLWPEARPGDASSSSRLSPLHSPKLHFGARPLVRAECPRSFCLHGCE